MIDIKKVTNGMTGSEAAQTLYDNDRYNNQATTNVINNAPLTDGMYINKNTGLETVDRFFCATDYIDVSAALSISTTVYIRGSAGICLYDANKVFIKGYGNADTVSTKKIYTIEIPDNCKYVRFSTAAANNTDFYYEINAVASNLKNSVSGLNSSISGLNTSISGLDSFNNSAFDIQDEPITTPFVAVGNGYWTGTIEGTGVGTGDIVEINNSAQYRYMALQPCTPGERVRLSGFYTPQAGIGVCAFVNAFGIYLGREESGTDYQTGEYDFTTPANCTLLGFYFNVTGGDTWKIENAVIKIGDYKANLNPNFLPSGLQDLETTPPRVQRLEEINDFCYDVKEEVIHNFVNDGLGFWQGSAVGNPVEAMKSPDYNRHTPFIPAKYGDTVTLQGIPTTQLAGAFALIDVNGNYLGRMDYGTPVGREFNFTISNTACVAIGWYVPNNSAGYPITDMRLIVNKGVLNLQITDDYKKILEDTLEIYSDKEMDMIAQMYNRGASPKTFTKKKAILIWGQSNAEGRNTLADAPQYIKDLNFVLPNANLCTSTDGSFNTWDQIRDWAFKLITAYYMTVQDTQEVYFIDLTVGGTSMAETGTTTKHWTPFIEKLTTGDTSLLRRFEAQIKAAIANLGSDFEIRAVIGHQGESDKDPVSAANYYINLRCFISYLRGLVGNAYLPFIAGTVPRGSSSYNATVEKAMLDVMNKDFYTYYVDLSQATMFDGLHLDAASSEAFGIAVYNKLKDYGV